MDAAPKHPKPIDVLYCWSVDGAGIRHEHYNWLKLKVHKEAKTKAKSKTMRVALRGENQLLPR